MRNNIQKLTQLMNHTQALNIIQPGKQLQMWQESHRPSSSILHEVFPVPLSLSPGTSTLYNVLLFHALVTLAYSFNQFRKAYCRRWDFKSLIEGNMVS